VASEDGLSGGSSEQQNRESPADRVILPGPTNEHALAVMLFGDSLTARHEPILPTGIRLARYDVRNVLHLDYLEVMRWHAFTLPQSNSQKQKHTGKGMHAGARGAKTQHKTGRLW
jgi:hypothetical protein